MSVQKIEIMRASRNGEWRRVWISFFTDYPEPQHCYYTQPDDNENEDEAVTELFNYIAQDIDVEHLRSQVLQECNRMREANFLDADHYVTIYIDDVVPEKREAHQSCEENNDNVRTMHASEENGISQSEVKQKLAHFSKSMKLFEENNCSVCLCSYKEILDENLHIVVPSCGHPLCCQCADNILMSTKKECPRCRGNITANSFNLMKFNADLEMVTQDQIVFL